MEASVASKPTAASGGGKSFVKKYKIPLLVGGIGLLALSHKGSKSGGSNADPTASTPATLVPVAAPGDSGNETQFPGVAGDYNPTYVTGPVSGSSVGGGGAGAGNVNSGDQPADTDGGSTPAPAPSNPNPKKPPAKKGAHAGGKGKRPTGGHSGHGGKTGHNNRGAGVTVHGHHFPGATGHTQTGQTKHTTTHTIHYPGHSQSVTVHHSGPNVGQVHHNARTPSEQRHVQQAPRANPNAVVRRSDRVPARRR